MLLEGFGYEVRVTHNGAAALLAMEKFVPHAALIDIGLPGMDGYELARRLRKIPHLNGINLIAQTGWGRKQDRERSRRAGFAHHLTKPLDFELLIKILSELSK
jgi:CheY-like chemotaxis protein